LIPNPIHKVLSTFQNCAVRALLMGGQACVFYGAAEFSRDTDFAVHADPENLDRLLQAMRDLRAEVIAVPPFSRENLLRGHAVHFRCHHPEAEGLRVDVMSKMRGVADFQELWERRTILQAEDGTTYELLSLPDLVQAKKTQRDKDWPMIRRLVEADRASCTSTPNAEQLSFWLREARTSSLLIDLAQKFPGQATACARSRPLIELATERNATALEDALTQEERAERNADREYWLPLKKELEQMRHS